MAEKHGLGRGLGALIKDRTAMENARSAESGVKQVSINHVKRSPLQPRKKFDPESLAELSASIRAQGILQPLLVRSVKNNYELIAGERRLRAGREPGRGHRALGRAGTPS